MRTQKKPYCIVTIIIPYNINHCDECSARRLVAYMILQPWLTFQKKFRNSISVIPTIFENLIFRYKYIN